MEGGPAELTSLSAAPNQSLRFARGARCYVNALSRLGHHAGTMPEAPDRFPAYAATVIAERGGLRSRIPLLGEP